MPSRDTIAALFSGRLPAGVGVVRLSGPGSRFAVETVCRSTTPLPGKAALRHLWSRDGRLLDRGFVLFFQAPRSFTGEDCAEFHVHGGKAVVALLLSELTELQGIRHADPGEFTLRAFQNGKLDLAQAEGLGDLIAAETEAQRRFAIQNAGGAQSELYREWRLRLIEIRAMIEAEMDFSDEADVLAAGTGHVLGQIESLCHVIRSHLQGYHTAEIIRDGYDVVIVGAPNAGKSSLLNTLARRDAAIVSDEAGTTRDLVEVSLDLNGSKVRLTDTAGLRADAGKVESIGIERALARAAQADLVLHLVDASAPLVADYVLPPTQTVLVWTKSDLLPADHPEEGLFVSVVDGRGIEELMAVLGRRAAAAVESTDVLPSQLRHVELLKQTLESLEQARSPGLAQELQAEHLRRAAVSLGRISGAVDVEDLLDLIFSRFCIGK